MSLLASILQYLPGLGSAIGGLSEGLAGGGATNGPSNDDLIAQQLGLKPRALPTMYQDQLRAVQQATQENNQLYGGIREAGGPIDLAFNQNRAMLANRQASIEDRAQQALFLREKFNEDVRQHNAQLALEQAKVDIARQQADPTSKWNIARFQQPGNFLEMVMKAHPDWDTQKAVDAAIQATQSFENWKKGTYTPSAEQKGGSFDLLGSIGSLLGKAATSGEYINAALIGLPGQRMTGRQAFENLGIVGPDQPGLDTGDVLGFGADVLTNPLTWLGGPAVGLLGRGAKAIPLVSRAAEGMGWASRAAPEVADALSGWEAVAPRAGRVGADVLSGWETEPAMGLGGRLMSPVRDVMGRAYDVAHSPAVRFGSGAAATGIGLLNKPSPPSSPAMTSLAVDSPEVKARREAVAQEQARIQALIEARRRAVGVQVPTSRPGILDRLNLTDVSY